VCRVDRLNTIWIVVIVASCGNGPDAAPVYVDNGSNENRSDIMVADASGLAEIGLPDWDLSDWVGQQSGTFGWPCYADNNCLSGRCVESLEGFICTETCDGTCPAGWTCDWFWPGASPVTFCLPEYGNLCRPCQEDSDCLVGMAQDSACVDYFGAGMFCAWKCDENEICPVDYECRPADLPDGSSESMCMKESGDCGCAKKYGFEKLITSCYIQSDESLCHGERVCANGVMGKCDAPDPAPESCNGSDDDCDGVTDEPGAAGCLLLYLDDDGDGYGKPGSAQLCLCPGSVQGGTTEPGDCDDSKQSVHPGAPESCNGADDNCNGFVDEGLQQTFYQDNDGDGFGLTGVTIDACKVPEGYAELGADCIDFNDEIHPGASEICNDIDDNCNGLVDEGLELVSYYPDNDDDGYGSTTGITYEKCAIKAGLLFPGWALNSTDCADNDASVYPGAPYLCDGKDNNCDGYVDRFCLSVCDGNWPYIFPDASMLTPYAVTEDLNGDGFFELFVNSGRGYAVLDSLGNVLSEASEPVGYYTAGTPTFADVDGYDMFNAVTQNLEVITANNKVARVYRYDESTNTLLEYSNLKINTYYSSSRVLVAGNPLSGEPEFTVPGGFDTENLFHAFRFLPAIDEVDHVQSVPTINKIPSYSCGRLHVDLNGDGIVELLVGDGIGVPTEPANWGGRIHVFQRDMDNGGSWTNGCAPQECFNTQIDGLWSGRVLSLVKTKGVIQTIITYFSQNVEGQDNPSIKYVWKYDLQGNPLPEYPQEYQEGTFVTDLNHDGFEEEYLAEMKGFFYDLNGDGFPDRLSVSETGETVEFAIWEESSGTLVKAEGLSFVPGGNVVNVQCPWDYDSNGRLNILVTDDLHRVQCYELGGGTWNQYSSMPSGRSAYRTGNSDNYEPNEGQDIDGDFFPDRVFRIPSGITGNGSFYSYLSSPDDVDFFLVDSKSAVEIVLHSPPERIYHLAVYSFSDKWVNATELPGKDGLADGLVWEDTTSEEIKYFQGKMVVPYRYGEHKFVVKIWSDGDYSAYWPYWLHVPM
jgi:hypothetical protein